MNPERRNSVLGLATTGLALIALSYFARPTLSSSYGRGVQYAADGIVVPFGNPEFEKRIQSTIPFDLQELDCGPYPDQTNDPYLSEQKSLMWDIFYDDQGNPVECADPYVGYDYIARKIEEQLPEGDRRPVTLVVMDSGINAEHEDFCDGQIDTELSKTFLDSVQIDTSPLTDEIGHGSAVAGIADACTGNGIGIASYGRHIDIASFKVMFPYSGGGMVNPSDWKNALEYLDEVARADSSRQFVVNMSFAGFSDLKSIREVIENLPNNVTLFAGAGNSQYGTPHNGLDYPAEYERVYAVGASVDEAPDTLCGFSYYSTTKDRFITAPGCFDLWGFHRENDDSFPYRDGLSGTSFSDPNVSGMVSYFLHVFPSLSPDEIMQTVFNTSHSVDKATEGSIDAPLKAISPLQAIQLLAAQAGYDISVPPEDLQYFLPIIQR